MLRILLTSTSYPRSEQDWQALFIREMLSALARDSELRLSYWGPPGPIPDDVPMLASESDLAFLAELSHQGGIAHRLRRHPLRGLAAGISLVRRMRHGLSRHERAVDIYHMNWLQSLLSLPGRDKRALVTVLGSDFRLLTVPGMIPLLRNRIARNRVALAPNAEWMISGLDAAFGRQTMAIRCVPFGIAEGFYEVRHRPGDGVRRWLTVLRLTRPKLGALLEWTKDLASTQDEFHLFGPMQERLELPDWINYHGPITPPALMAEWYPRATGFITLSEHDEGRPQVLLEAMAAGVPVIASRLEAHNDLIHATGGGILVGNKTEFAAAVSRLSDPHIREGFSIAARKAIEMTYGTWDDCSQRYSSLYEQLSKTGNQ